MTIGGWIWFVIGWIANWFVLCAIIVGLAFFAWKKRAAKSLSIILAVTAGSLAFQMLPLTWQGQNHRRVASNLDIVVSDIPDSIRRDPDAFEWMDRKSAELDNKRPVVVRRLTKRGQPVIVFAERRSNRNPTVAVESALRHWLKLAPTEALPATIRTITPTGSFGAKAKTQIRCVQAIPNAYCIWADQGTVGVMRTIAPVNDLIDSVGDIRDSVERRASRYHPFKDASALFVSLGLLALMLVFSLVAHELGHALVARIVGADVLGICLGMGPLLFDRDISVGSFGGHKRTVRFMLRRVPIGGYISCVPKTEAGYREKQTAIWLAGPATNIAFALIGALLSGVSSLFVLINVILTVVNVMPYSKLIPELGRRIGTDGYQALASWKGTRTYDRSTMSAPFTYRAETAIERGQTAQAEYWIEAGLRELPNDASLRELRDNLAVETR